MPEKETLNQFKYLTIFEDKYTYNDLKKYKIDGEERSFSNLLMLAMKLWNTFIPLQVRNRILEEQIPKITFSMTDEMGGIVKK